MALGGGGGGVGVGGINTGSFALYCNSPVGYLVSKPASHAGSWGLIPDGAQSEILIDKNICILYHSYFSKNKHYIISNLLFKKTSAILCIEVSVKKKNAMPSIKVTFQNRQTLYAIPKSNFEKTKYYTLYLSYFSKKLCPDLAL